MAKKITKKEANKWRENWEKSCSERKPLSDKTPPGFLIEVDVVNQILKNRPDTKELWVSFGQETPSGPIKLILQPYSDPDVENQKNLEEGDEDDIYDEFGTCCPKL